MGATNEDVGFRVNALEEVLRRSSAPKSRVSLATSAQGSSTLVLRRTRRRRRWRLLSRPGQPDAKPTCTLQSLQLAGMPHTRLIGLAGIDGSCGVFLWCYHLKKTTTSKSCGTCERSRSCGLIYALLTAAKEKAANSKPPKSKTLNHCHATSFWLMGDLHASHFA